ncbi:hypothetical protein PV04_10521 [Phialophora macrospora]|uniref:FAD/NAD(P)-binding domain-containing protein n=1 Tax=Phialophora macrospora TaxID=1851006 RepID=A0A0D2F5S3_9EURO|nr:hypothetical protein PV04_10521 [Phialophora macrospora]
MASAASPPSGVARPIPTDSTNGAGTPKQPVGAANALHFTLRDVPVENFRPLRVIVIGAGFSGIYLRIRFPDLLRNVELVVYEKNPGMGGTWCVLPAHSYVYTFEPNPEWSSFYAGSAEIQRYLEKVADTYSAGRFIKLSHKDSAAVAANRLTAEDRKVDVEEVDTGDRLTDEADIVISARGGLNDDVWPQIEGLWSFKGKVVHSAAWDESCSHKRVGIIGSGSSAIQIVPKLQELPGTQRNCFIRSKTWISSTFGDSAMQKLHIDDIEFTEEDRQKFMSDEEKYHDFRKIIESDGSAMHPFLLKGSAMSQAAREAFTQLMHSRLAKKLELADLLVPDFAPGCRRLTPGPGFLEALTEDNVEVISAPIRASCHPAFFWKTER